MSKCLSLILTLILGSIIISSCQPQKEQVDKSQLVTAYYEALNDSDFAELGNLYFDSVRVSEGDYHSVYTIEEYQNWLSWDSVFHPNYEIIEMKEINEAIEVTVSKSDIRVLFLNEMPLTTKHRITFKENKIHKSEVLHYVTMDDEKWSSNRAMLVSWVQENMSELDGFLIDQTKQGALDYIKAIESYQNK